MVDRLENESFLDYTDRLISNKKNYDLDHSEIYEMLFGVVISGTESRKRIYGLKDMIETLKAEGFEKLTDDEVFRKLESKKIEIQKERMKLSTLRNDLNKTVRDESRRELLLEEMIRVIPRADKVEFRPREIQDMDKGYLLRISDIHYSSFFKSINNEYSIEILHERFEILLGELMAFIEKEGVKKLYVANQGDSLQGLIRISDLKKNQIGLMESVVGFSRFMGDFLNALSEYVDIEYYHVPTANHSDIRLFDPKNNQTGENLELLMINYIHDYLRKNDKVFVALPEENKDYLEFNIQGFDFISLHGHQTKNVNTYLEKVSMRNRKFYDFCLMGHYHTGYEKTLYEANGHNVELLVSGSIVGSDPYADTLLLGSKSSAKLDVFQKTKGRVQSNTIILN